MVLPQRKGPSGPPVPPPAPPVHECPAPLSALVVDGTTTLPALQRNGSSACPYKFIQEAVDSKGAASAIFLSMAPGNYLESVLIPATAGFFGMQSFGGNPVGITKLSFLGASFFQANAISVSTVDGAAFLARISSNHSASPNIDPASIGTLNLPGAQIALDNMRVDKLTAVTVSARGGLLSPSAVWNLPGPVYLWNYLIRNGAKVTADSAQIIGSEFSQPSNGVIFTTASPSLLDSFSNYSGVITGGATFAGGVVVGV